MNQNNHREVLQLSPVMRPSQITSNSSNKSTFMDVFMQHLQQVKTNDTKKPSMTPMIAVPTSTPEKKLPKPKKPREPSIKKPRKKKDTNCTTIGLQIQIRDPKTEPTIKTPLDSSIESVVETSSNFTSNEIDTSTPPLNVISTTVEQYKPTDPSVNQAIYYNMDSSENEPAEQFVYEPEPAIYHHTQPMNITNECVSVSNRVKHNSNTNHHQNDGYPPLQPYNIYSDPKNNPSLIRRFNLSHPNVTNNAVV